MTTNEEFSQAIAAAFALLFAIGLRRNVTRWFAFRERLEKEIKYQLSDRNYVTILNNVNTLSWERYRCLFTSIIICSNSLPGMPLFKKAFSLGAITVFPDKDDHYQLMQLSHSLQARVYEVVAKTQVLNTAHAAPKAPVLF